jgi:hypothetical protein
MEEKMKKIILGIIVGIVVTMSTNVLAASDLLAKYASLKFIIDGESKTLSNQPVLINGSTYLPLREIGTLLDYKVDYNGKSKTITLTENQTTTTVGTIENSDEKKTCNLVVGSKSESWPCYFKNDDVYIMLSRPYVNILFALGYEVTGGIMDEYKGLTLVVNDTEYGFKYADTNNVYVNGKAETLDKTLFVEEMGFSSKVIYVPASFFASKGLFTYTVIGTKVSLTKSN